MDANNLNPSPTRSITLPKGFRAAAATAGIKASSKPDIAIIAADQPSPAATVFTQNTIKGAPILVGMQHIRDGVLQAFVINSGNSNVCTGEQGLVDATTMCETVADHLGCKPADVLPSSTGVIGRPLPMHLITPGIQSALPNLAASQQADTDAATAILTTDLVTKTASRTLTLTTGQTITLGGIAKGSGMIAPNMATMLAFITTDIAIASNLLQQALSHATTLSFNRITVDSDTSTSDTVAIIASEAMSNPRLDTTDHPDYPAFLEALTSLCKELAYHIIKDGEGATKIYRVLVNSAATQHEADTLGRAVADSPLVKTAVHGQDPNWGRLAMALGKTGVQYDPRKLTISIGDIPVFEAGIPIPMNDDNTAKLNAIMSEKEITFTFDLAIGSASTEFLGCDLSREYITINADYTT
ncbi:bifunctional glutamate N-acetyltransferase/amino-acid acetyltransferase ArgJ [Poriferisphaera sp. WC338]|uniref:bifunctional glutamate N-acetyltransferase/amino-acid acetyltransferase ArgJ n=1 Tax=Poriferisphaera sp. WC338 TaxID=3425129 RepID=UPI003D817993